MLLSFPRISKSNQDIVPENHAWTRLVNPRTVKVTVCKCFLCGTVFAYFNFFPKRGELEICCPGRKKRRAFCFIACLPVHLK